MAKQKEKPSDNVDVLDDEDFFKELEKEYDKLLSYEEVMEEVKKKQKK